VTTVLATALAAVAAAHRPNIVVILADDIGYADLSCYGAQHARTPQIDRLAAEGLRCTDAHAPAAVCTPTRRALLTGRYSWRQEAGSRILPGDAPATISAGTVTVASLLKGAGYRTGVVGKWHVGLGGPAGPDWNGEIAPGPREIGFDYSFLIPATGDRVPCVFVENQRVVGLEPADPIRVSFKEKIGSEPTGGENRDLLAIDWVNGHNNTIVRGISRIGWMSGGHAARWVDEEIADTLARKAAAFIEGKKMSPSPFFLLLTPHGIHVPRVPHPRFRGASPSGNRGDAIQELDDTVGQVLAALERQGLPNETLVIFSSDNGGVLDKDYAEFYRYDYNPNAPLSGRKGSLLEGGHRVPFLARWPGRIKPGSTSDELFALVDLPATLAALTGTALPRDAAPDSIDVHRMLLGHAGAKGREHLVIQGNGTTALALRRGPWKYVPPATGPAARGNAKPQLYRLETDIAESRNLAEEQPAKLAELAALLEKIRAHGRDRP
jgi:arylsulfatase A-like enzyme